MYFSCFYAVSALLIKNGIIVSSHTGVRQKFGKLFVKPGFIDKTMAKHYTDLFEKRQKGDYNDFFDFDEDTAKYLYPLSINFIQSIDELLKK